jgi:hypothetical protein
MRACLPLVVVLCGLLGPASALVVPARALMPEGARVSVSGAGARPIEGRVRLIEPYARTKVSALGIEEQRVNVVIDLTDPGSSPRLGHGYKVDAAVQVFQATGASRVPSMSAIRASSR